MVLTLSHLRGKLTEVIAPVSSLDREDAHVAAFDAARLIAAEKGSATEQLAYIIYTSGTTAGPRASRSSTPASATSCGSRPRSTGSRRRTASTRA